MCQASQCRKGCIVSLGGQFVPLTNSCPLMVKGRTNCNLCQTNLAKTPSWLSRMVFNVRLGLRRFAPFSLPPRAIIDRSKSAQRKLSAFASVVIRLEFYILLHFEEKSSILRRLLKICKVLYISKIRSYIY